MIAVAIIGVLASIAIPGYQSYLERARETESIATLDAMFKGAAQYAVAQMDSGGYLSEDEVHSGCLLDPVGSAPFLPLDFFENRAKKKPIAWSGYRGYQDLGVQDGMYYNAYSYRIVPRAYIRESDDALRLDSCGIENAPSVYIMLSIAPMERSWTTGEIVLYALTPGMRDGELYKPLGIKRLVVTTDQIGTLFPADDFNWE